jgi:dihydroorotase
MKPLLVNKGHLIDPGRGIDSVGSLLVRDGTIAWVGTGDAAPPGNDFDVINAAGLVVCPGFIDLHCHLREPGFESKETIATGTRAASRGGFTTVCCMPNTSPAIDSPAVIQFIREKAGAAGGVRVAPIACVTKGRRGTELADLGALAAAGAAGFSDDGDPVRDAEIMRQALTASKTLGLPIIDHCEDPVGGHPEGEVKMVARDIALAQQTGGWIHIAHVSAAGSADLIAAARENGVRVTAEVTPHHLTLTAADASSCGSLAKVNPPLRAEHDRLAMVRALKTGAIDIIATDHAPHTAGDKPPEMALAAAGISGFETAFGSVMRLVTEGHLTLGELVYRLSVKPAEVMGGRFGKIGALAAGFAADICILDPGREWTVDPGSFVSKGRNTPLGGRVLKGKIVATIVGGRVEFKDDSLELAPGAIAAL